MTPRSQSDSSTEVLQILLEEVRGLRGEFGSDVREVRDDVKCMREELAESSGKMMALEHEIRSWVGGQREIEARVKELSRDFEAHKDAEVDWQHKAEKTFANLTSAVEQVLPIAKSHEKIVYQAKGAVRATKILWGLAAAIIGTGGFASGFVISGAKSSASQPASPLYVMSASSPPSPPLVAEEIVLENPVVVVDGGASKAIKSGGKK